MTRALTAADDPLYVEHEVPVCDRVARREQVARVVGRTVAVQDASASPGYLSYVLSVHLHIDLFLGLLITIPAMFVLGLVIHTTVIRPLRGA